MSDKLPEPIVMPDGTVYQPKAKTDPVPPGVLEAMGLPEEERSSDEEGETLYNAVRRQIGLPRQSTSESDDLPEVPNISSFGGPPPDLFPDQGGNGTHFDESRFIQMIIRRDEEEIQEYLREVLIHWIEFDFRQGQIH
jgi:hypothetical protein